MSVFNLFTISYWFATPRAISTTALTVLFVAFGVMVVVGLALKSAAHKGAIERFLAKAVERWGSMSMNMGFLGFIMIFLRYQRTPFFMLRFWMLVWLIGLLFWAYRIWKYQTKKLPELRERYAEEAKRYAFIPR